MEVVVDKRLCHRLLIFLLLLLGEPAFNVASSMAMNSVEQIDSMGVDTLNLKVLVPGIF